MKTMSELKFETITTKDNRLSFQKIYPKMSGYCSFIKIIASKVIAFLKVEKVFLTHFVVPLTPTNNKDRVMNDPGSCRQSFGACHTLLKNFLG